MIKIDGGEFVIVVMFMLIMVLYILVSFLKYKAVYEKNKLLKSQDTNQAKLKRATDLLKGDSLEDATKDISFIIKDIIKVYFKEEILSGYSISRYMTNPNLVDEITVKGRITGMEIEEDQLEILRRVKNRVSVYLLHRLAKFINQQEIHDYLLELINELYKLVMDSVLDIKHNRNANNIRRNSSSDTKRAMHLLAEEKNKLNTIIKYKKEILEDSPYNHSSIKQRQMSLIDDLISEQTAHVDEAKKNIKEGMVI